MHDKGNDHIKNKINNATRLLFNHVEHFLLLQFQMPALKNHVKTEEFARWKEHTISALARLDIQDGIARVGVLYLHYLLCLRGFLSYLSLFWNLTPTHPIIS